MKRASAVGMFLLFLGALMAWSATPVQAQRVAPTSSSQDPAQLSTAAVVFVKVNAATGTDTIMVFNRQQLDFPTTTSETATITVHAVFYDSVCKKKFDQNVKLTRQDVEAVLVSSFFGATAPGVVLADSGVGATNQQWAVSSVVIDGNFVAVYERQGSPLLRRGGTGGGASANTAVWGGFSNKGIDDWFIGGFTMLQMICPLDSSTTTSSNLKDDMNTLASIPSLAAGTVLTFTNSFGVVNVYDDKEVLKRSNHNQKCFCNTDSKFFGDFADVIASMATTGLGTFHWDRTASATVDATQGSIGWRVIGNGLNVWWDARLRTTPTS